MAFYVYVLSIVPAVILCLKISYVKSSYVSLKNDGPTTLGGSTDFFAELFGCGTGQFQYCYESVTGKSCLNSGHHSNFTVSDWPSTGSQKVTVVVEQMKPYNYCGTASSTVYITDTIIAELKTIPSNYFKVGPVSLSVQIHDTSHMFSSVTYYWDFGDGSYLNDTVLGQVKHNFTENKTYKVRVQIFAHARGQLYNGTVYKYMTFDVDLDPNLVIIPKNTSTLMLPSDKSDKAYVARGYQQLLVVTYNNPYSIVKNTYTQWDFLSGQETTLPGSTIIHTFTKDGPTSVWVTPTFITKRGNPNKTIPFPQQIVVEEPITGLMFGNKSFTIPYYLTASIMCHGSSPFKMCWRLYQTSVHGRSVMENCTTVLSPTCNFHINHTISQHGLLILKVIVLNRVGSAHLAKHFSIPTPVPNHDNTSGKTASTVVSIIVCIVVVIILLFIAKKIYSIRHRSVLETADFDFRDEDCRSVDSLNMGKRWCPSFRLCKKLSKNKEVYPLLESWDSNTGSHYSTIL